MRVSLLIAVLLSLSVVQSIRVRHQQAAHLKKFEELIYPKLFADKDILSAITKDPKAPENEKLIIGKIVDLAKSDPTITQALADDLFANDPALAKAGLSEADKSAVVKFVLNHPGLMSDKQPTEAELDGWLKEDANAKAIYDKVKKTLDTKSSHLLSHLSAEVSHQAGLYQDIKKLLYQDPEIKAKVDAKQANTP